ncbi:MAG: Crp/Fnr family transcriptional regulator [Chloroflexi bacterium]|nr:Crp/Fnr family transcriptional regulator [Chloroflexota bacterium]
MSSQQISAATSGNRLLAALPADEHVRLQPYLDTVHLALKQVLYRDQQPISHVYFAHDCVASVLQLAEDAEPVEVATVGREGMVGIPLLLGTSTTPGMSLCQVPGAASRMAADDFRRLVQPGTALHDLLHRYIQALLILMAQNAACNSRHPLEQRCARWLCLTHDRVNGDALTLTQEFLGQMLDVRRAGVSEVASRLQAEGLIQYSRGRIEVADRAGLEARACDCYRIIRDAFEQMLEPN